MPHVERVMRKDGVSELMQAEVFHYVNRLWKDFILWQFRDS